MATGGITMGAFGDARRRLAFSLRGGLLMTALTPIRLTKTMSSQGRRGLEPVKSLIRATLRRSLRAPGFCLLRER
jgi:hypothetical protein